MLKLAALFLPAVLAGASLHGLAQQPAKAHCTVITAEEPAGNEAAKAYRAGNWEFAAAKYKELLAARPDDADLIAGYAQSELKLDKLEEAFTIASAAVEKDSKSAVLRTALGEVRFRKGQISDAEKDFFAAQRLDPCNARARLGIAQVARAESNYATSQQQIRVARQLNQADPDIQIAWLLTLPVKEQIANLEASLNGAPENERTVSRKAYLRQLQRHDAGESHHCHATSAIEKTTLPLIPVAIDAVNLWNEANTANVPTWGLNVEINGKQAHLLVDTGAGGIYIARGFAARAGLKAEEKIQVSGIGDHGPQSSFVSHANSIKVGDISFSDCTVDVSDAHSVVGMDGLIGMDVFAQYLITLDFPVHQIRLGPLPVHPGESAPASELRTESEDRASTASSDTTGAAVSQGPRDRYIAPEMRDYTEIYRFSHALLVPTRLNHSDPQLMLIDTGSYSTVLSARAAQPFIHSFTSTTGDRGISGIVNKVYHGHLDLQFDHVNDVEPDLAIYPRMSLSAAFGTEIAGLLGYPVLRQLTIDIDYRDGLVHFTHDANHGDNRGKGPQPPCGGCVPTSYVQR